MAEQIDLTKLGEWQVTSDGALEGGALRGRWRTWLPSDARDFAVLARNAFDILDRRKGQHWSPSPLWVDERFVGWVVAGNVPGTAGAYVGDTTGETIIAADPFTALVEADRWYRENVEDKSDA